MVLQRSDAKSRGEGNQLLPVAVYAPAMSRRLRDWLDLDARLRRAVHDDLLTLVFQPKFNLRENRLVRVEALLRWRNKEYGDIPEG